MKATLLIILGTAVAAAAPAENDFPCDPAYAELLADYEEVTPAMAKEATPLGAVGIAGEPLLLRDVNGMPLCYMAATYELPDAAGAERWDEVIKRINAGERIPGAGLASAVEAFYAGAYGTPERCYVLGTFTCEWGANEVEGGLFPGLIGYPAAYKAAAVALGEEGGGDVYFSRLIAFGVHTLQIFEFENDAGETVAFAADEHGFARPEIRAETEALTEALLEGRFDVITDDPERALENRARGGGSSRRSSKGLKEGVVRGGARDDGRGGVRPA